MASSSAAQSSTFLGLPPEIRNIIYGFIDDPIDICHPLWLCRQLYHETHQMFYDRFTLDLDVFAGARRRVFRVRVDHPQDLLPHPTQPNRRPKWWSFQLHLGHGQNGIEVLHRLESIPEESKARLRKINLFVPTLWAPPGPPIPLRWQHYSCQCVFCDVYGRGLQPLLLQSLRSAINPHVLVDIYYHMRSALFLTPSNVRLWTSTDDAILSLFKTQSGLPGCKRLIVCCGNGSDMEVDQVGEVVGADASSVEEWAGFCNALTTIMRNGSSLEHLEVWIPASVLLDDEPGFEIEFSRIARGLNDAEIDPRHRIYFNEPFWVHFLTKIHGLKSVKVMLWNHWERTSQQSMSVTPLEVEGLREYLESKMVTRG
ncbi:MAG: hypothetical protein Q9181_002144 [Wetmoreana brouardii]